MRHGLAHRKFSRTTNQRKALLCNLAVNIIERERIVTTLPKAKEIRPYLEKLITKGKEGKIAYNVIYQKLRHKASTLKLISVLSERCKDRNGGYLRIFRCGYRYGDQAPMALIEFVDKV